MTPKICAIMPTCGRAARQPDLIADAVRDFVNQDYPAESRHLLIVNDAPGHILTTRVPGVKIINLGQRFTSLGTKCNFAVAFAYSHLRCDIGMMWEDDDRSLAHRMSMSAEILGDFEYWNPGLVWYHEKGKERRPDGIGVMHHASCYKLASFVGRYQPISKGHDAAANHWARTSLQNSPYRITDPNEIFYVYQWGWSDFHLSGQRDMEKAYNDFNPGPPGRYEIII